MRHSRQKCGRTTVCFAPTLWRMMCRIDDVSLGDRGGWALNSLWGPESRPLPLTGWHSGCPQKRAASGAWCAGVCVCVSRCSLQRCSEVIGLALSVQWETWSWCVCPVRFNSTTGLCVARCRQEANYCRCLRTVWRREFIIKCDWSVPKETWLGVIVLSEFNAEVIMSFWLSEARQDRQNMDVCRHLFFDNGWVIRLEGIEMWPFLASSFFSHGFTPCPFLFVYFFLRLSVEVKALKSLGTPCFRDSK